MGCDMEQIRYTERICTDRERIGAFLERSRVGVIGMETEDYPYAVPVNYAVMGDRIYFHGMGSGKKSDLLDRGPKICFTIYEEIGTVADPVPCHVDTAYMSVMVMGTVQRVADSDEAAAALQQLLVKYMPGSFKQAIGASLIEGYRSAMDSNAVAVYRIEPDALTAKENRAEPDLLFDVRRPRGGSGGEST